MKGTLSILLTIFAGGSFATLGSVNTATWARPINTQVMDFHTSVPTLRAFMFLKSMPTSRVTPSPKRRWAAATCHTVLSSHNALHTGPRRTSNAYSFSTGRLSTGVAYFLICCSACIGLCAPPVRQPWHGHAVCCAALMSRRIALLDAAAVDMVCLARVGRRRRHGEQLGSGGAAEREGLEHI